MLVTTYLTFRCWILQRLAFSLMMVTSQKPNYYCLLSLLPLAYTPTACLRSYRISPSNTWLSNALCPMSSNYYESERVESCTI